MSRKPIVGPYFVDATSASSTSRSISMASNFLTKPTSVSYQDNISYQIDVTTSDSIGTFTVQVSDNYNKDTLSGTWADMGTAGTANAANDTIICEIDPGARFWVRLKYTVGTAGTGTCTVLVTAKNLGA